MSGSTWNAPCVIPPPQKKCGWNANIHHACTLRSVYVCFRAEMLLDERNVALSSSKPKCPASLLPIYADFRSIDLHLNSRPTVIAGRKLLIKWIATYEYLHAEIFKNTETYLKIFILQQFWPIKNYLSIFTPRSWLAISCCPNAHLL